MHIIEAPWEWDVPPFQITDNVWYVGSRQVSNHLIDTGDGLVLIDSGWPRVLYLLLESIRAAGFNPAQIRYIIHSHYHIDHMGGTRCIMEKYGCRTVLGRKDLPLAGERIDLSLCEWHDSMWVTGFPITDPVSDGDTLTLGNTTFTFREAPGHTPGTLGIFFNSTWKKIPVRVGMHGGVGRNTLESQFIREHHLSTSVRQDYHDSLIRMKKEKVDVTLGNHPYNVHMLERHMAAEPGANPFIDASVWPNFLDEQLKQYAALIERDPMEEADES